MQLRNGARNTMADVWTSLLVGLKSLVPHTAAQTAGFLAPDVTSLATELLLICLFTALIEELIFRGALATILARRFVQPNPLLKAAVASALTFAILHIASDMVYNATSALLVAQGLAKFLQASLFGFCMAALFLKARARGRTFARAIALPVLVHFVFDLLYFGPSYLATGALPATYLTGSCGDLAVLLVTSALLVPPSIIGARALRGEVLPCLTDDARN